MTDTNATVQEAAQNDGMDGNTQLKWNVKVNPRDTRGDHSSIIEQQSENWSSPKYSHLFWEASTMSGFSISLSNACCVRLTELSNGLLWDALVAHGLLIDEATKMSTHLLPSNIQSIMF